jgi:hypothetical protein
MACEQGNQDRIWELVEIIATGKMPDGHTADDLRAMGLPLPGELYREEQPDGTILIALLASHAHFTSVHSSSARTGHPRESGDPVPRSRRW